MPNSLYSARNRQLGIFVTPKHYGAVGDGVADDTAPWAAFQAAPSVLKAVPAGRYLVSGTVKRYDAGCMGNGEFIDASSAWDQATGDRARDSLIVHYRSLDANATLVSPAIKLQTVVNYEVPTPAGTPFKRVINNYSDMTLNGYYDTMVDGNNNFTADGTVVRNNMAGLFGSLAHLFYVSDATEAENPDITTMGATKNGCVYLQPTKRTRFSSDGYMFGGEVICLNTSADSDTAIPYVNDDNFAFPWYVGWKISAQTDSSPVSAGILMTGSATAKHGFYNGIVVGGSCFVINNDDQGPVDTVAINLASHRTANGFSDRGIKFRTNNRHTDFVEGHKSRSILTRFMYEAGDCGIAIEAAAGSAPYMHFRTGATSAASGGAVVTQGQIDSNASWTRVQSTSGEVQLSAAAGTAIYKATSARFAPDADGTLMLGGAANRWNTVYASTGAINTSDERAKTKPEAFTDALLDAWADVDFVSYRFKDAAKKKGKKARKHAGVIAQHLQAVFAKHGLDAAEWGLLCYDEWEATPESVEIVRAPLTPAEYEQILVTPARMEMRESTPAQFKDGKQIAPAEYVEVEAVPAIYKDGALIKEATFEETRHVTKAVEAGNRYGIRYEEALCIEAAYQRRRADRMEARLARLEALL